MDASRLFLAIPVADRAREEIRCLVPHPLPGRTVPPRNWHVTLRFLGQVTAARQEALARALRAAHLGPRGVLTLSRLDGFPGLGRSRVLWLGPAPGDAGPAPRVAAAVDTAIAAVGMPPRDRPFHAHLTLARLRPPRDLRELARSFRGGVDLPVGEVVLFRSLPGDDAPRYDPLESFPLTSTPEP